MLQPHERKDEPFLTNWKVWIKDDTIDIVKSCLDAVVAPLLNQEDPRTGVISYAYSKTVQHQDDSLRKNCLYFTELFTDLDSFQTHLTEAESESVVSLFNCISGRVVGFVNAPLWHEGIQAACVTNQVQPATTTIGHTLNRYPKNILGGKYGRRILPLAKQAVMFELRIQPKTKMESDHILALLTPLTKFTKSDFNMISSYVIQGKGWWRRDATSATNLKLKTRDAKIPQECYTQEFGSSDTIDFRVIYSQTIGLRHKFSRALVTELAKCIETSVVSEFIVTAEDLEQESLVDLLEYFEDNKLLTSDRRILLSGFLLHPFYTKSWKGVDIATKSNFKKETEMTSNKKNNNKTAAKINLLESGLAKRFGGGGIGKKRNFRSGSSDSNSNTGNGNGGINSNKNNSTSSSSLGNSSNETKKEQNQEQNSSAFRVRNHVIKNQAEAIVLEARARKCPALQNYFVVPLMDYLRTITRLGHSDKEVPIGTLFGVLERMRYMKREVEYMNSLVQMKEEERERKGNLTRVQAVFMKLSLMGRGEYRNKFGTIYLRIDGLNQLIHTMEQEYAVIVDRAKLAVVDGASIEYMGLQELYTIGSVVTTRSLSGLGGMITSLKVIDCSYEAIRSLMGSLRYSFRVTFETIIYMGQHFITVPFTEIMGEWKNVKDITSLSYQPLRTDVNNSWIKERIQMLNSLSSSDQSYSYMEYPAGSFFPSLGRRSKSNGAASSSVMRVAPGQVIIDVQTGLNLGYAPSSRTGNLGISMGMITKVYLDFIRKSTGAKINLEEMNDQNAGLFTAFESFPMGVNAQPWACAIGFSMTTKTW